MFQPEHHRPFSPNCFARERRSLRANGVRNELFAASSGFRAVLAMALTILACGCTRAPEPPVAAASNPAIPLTTVEEAPVLSEEDSALVKGATAPSSEAETA